MNRLQRMIKNKTNTAQLLSDSSWCAGGSGCRVLLLLLLWLSLLCCLPAAKACLQCDHKVRRLHEDLSLSALTMQEQIAIRNIYDQAYVRYRESSSNRRGVIDLTTLYRARTEYENEFNRFFIPNTRGSLSSKAIQIMEMGRRILEKHLDSFISHRLCPNQCGILKRRVLDCVTCRHKIYTCVSPSGQWDCGEISIQAEEGDQAVLDCFLPWHPLLLGKPKYHFFRAPGEPQNKTLNESDFRALVVTDDSHVVLNQLQVNEQGTYRCSLKAQNGSIFYQVTFLLTVTSAPNETDQRIATLPALPHVDDIPSKLSEDLLVYVITIVTFVSVVASICLTVVLGMMIN
ncbi:izumo sperm-egg fusion protein 1 [Solea solea]|uniref:izumo sperm-egg fusion protein 1 n=1 Tax=Solea solea TaxID=90069 RepID=UPI00272BF359|nr:izumo sperm-egg fusion protein 1 [Solea solea]